MSDLYISPEIQDALKKYKRFVNWCWALVSGKKMLKYLLSQGLNSFEAYFFIFFFYPFCYSVRVSWNGVCFPFNLLKRRVKKVVYKKEKVNVRKTRTQKRIEKKKKKRNQWGMSFQPHVSCESSTTTTVQKVKNSQTKRARSSRKPWTLNCRKRRYLARLGKLISEQEKFDSGLRNNLYYNSRVVRHLAYAGNDVNLLRVALVRYGKRLSVLKWRCAWDLHYEKLRPQRSRPRHYVSGLRILASIQWDLTYFFKQLFKLEVTGKW